MSSVEGLRADIVWEANTGQAIADLGAVGEEYSRTTGAMSDQALRLAAAQDRLTASISRSGPESRAAKTATLAYRQELAALAAEADAASAAVTKQAEAQARAASAAATTQAANNLAAARSAGRALTTYVTAPTLIASAVALKLGLDFEDSMRLIQTQAGASGREVERMSQGVLDLVHSGQSFGQTANDMAKGLFYIESEGIRGAKALEILKVAAAGAAVGQTDLGETANALTSVMRVYGLDANQAAGAMATLNASVGAGKLHMEDLNSALATKFLPTAKQLGITLPQALAALDVFTKAGPNAASAATNLTTAIFKMLAPTSSAASALYSLGLSSTQLGEDLQRGGLPVALADLVKGYDKLEQSQGKAAASTAVADAFGKAKGGSSVLTLIQQYGSYMKGLDQIQKQANPGKFWDQVAVTMDLPSQKIKEDVAKITADFVKAGVVLAPIAASLASDIEKIASAFGHLPGPVKEGLGVIVLALAVGGPVVRAVVGTIGLINKLSLAFPKVAVSATAAAAEADPAIASIGATAETSAAEVGVLAGAETEVGTAAVVAGAEAGGAFAGIGAAATAALGPIGLVLAGLGAIYAYSQAGGPQTHTHHTAKGGAAGGTVFERDGKWYETEGTGRGQFTRQISASEAAALGANTGSRGNTAAERRRAEAEDAYYRRQRSRRPGAGGQGGREAPFTVTIPTNIQVRYAKAQYKGDVAGERRALDEEKKFLEAELKKARKAHDQQEELAALQALQTVKDQQASLKKTGSSAKGKKDLAADQAREGKLESQVTSAQSAEQSATTVKAEQAAYERERKARLQLVALYEREAHDPALSASQRERAEKDAAAQRKKLAAISDSSREDAIKLAVLEAQNAVAKAEVGSAAYDRAMKAEDKALAAEIAYYNKREHRRNESEKARAKDIAHELAARKKRAALDKTEVTSVAGARAEQAQVVAALADIISKFAGNATPIGDGRAGTHLYEAVQELRQIKGHTGRLATSGRFPASEDQMASASAVGV